MLSRVTLAFYKSENFSYIIYKRFHNIVLIFPYPTFLQVNIDIEDVNDNAPEFESSTVRISVPENADLGTPIYAANAHDRDSGDSAVVSYRLLNIDGDTTTETQSASTSSGAGGGSGTLPKQSADNLFAIDARSGHLTLSRHLDYEQAHRHSLVVMATDSGDPPLSANLTILVEVQDINDNAPVFEQSGYAVKVSESLAANSKVCVYICLIKKVVNSLYLMV